MKNPSARATGNSPPNPPSMDRRTILRVGAAGSLAVVTVPLGCGGEPPSLSNGPIVFRNVSMVPVGALVSIPGVAGFVGRDDAGLYAMTSICTHMGCRIPAPLPAPGTAALGINCPCHGSQYDKNGAVTRGPAPAPLQHYRVDLAADGTITVQGTIPVSAAARTPVP